MMNLFFTFFLKKIHYCLLLFALLAMPIAFSGMMREHSIKTMPSNYTSSYWSQTAKAALGLLMVGAVGAQTLMPPTAHLQIKPVSDASSDIQGMCSSHCVENICRPGLGLSVIGSKSWRSCARMREPSECFYVETQIHTRKNTTEMMFRITPVSVPPSDIWVICSAHDSVVIQAVPWRDAEITPILKRSNIQAQDNTFYLGQKNFTSYLRQHAQGNFFLVEPINFSMFSELEQLQYPLYDNAYFSGTLDTLGHSIDSFSIVRNGSAAFFGGLRDARIKANFTNAYVSGKLPSALLATTLTGKNKIDLTVDDVSITTSESDASAGIVAGMARESAGDIVLKAGTVKIVTSGRFSHIGTLAISSFSTYNMDLDIKNFYGSSLSYRAQVAPAIGFAFFASHNILLRADKIFSATKGAYAMTSAVVADSHLSDFTIDLNAQFVNLRTSGAYSSCGVGTGAASQGSEHNMTILVHQATLETLGDYAHTSVGLANATSIEKGNIIKVRGDQVQMRATGREAHCGLGMGYVASDKYQQISINVHDIQMASDACTAMGIGEVAQPISGDIIIGGDTHIVINGAGEKSGLGIGCGPKMSSSTTDGVHILLLSGNGTLNTGAHLMQDVPQCTNSLLDTSGTAFNIDHMGCDGAFIVKSTEASEWRFAHHFLKNTLCRENDTSCHYNNEKLMALIDQKSDKQHIIYLVSEQTYPNHPNPMGVMRVTQLMLNSSLPPQVNEHFALNGFRLFTPTKIPRASLSIVGAHIKNGTIGLMEHAKNTIQTASFPLNETYDSYYAVKEQTLAGRPIQWDGDGFWQQQNNTIVYYVNNTPVKQIKLENKELTTLGATHASRYIYVVVTTGDDTAIAERYFANDAQLDPTWKRVLHLMSTPNDGLRLQVNDSDQPSLALLKANELSDENDPNCVLTVTLPSLGGMARWHYTHSLIAEQPCNKRSF